MVVAEAITPVHVAIGCVGLAAVAAWLDALLKSREPELVYAPTDFHEAVLSRCPTLRSVYRPTPLLTNGHAETILVAKLRKPPGVDYRREVLLTKDGGAVAIDWEHFDDAGKGLPEDAPVLILFPGLTGGSCDSYVQHAVLQARHAGIRAAVFNSRGTADSPVLTPQFYSASFTDDTREVVAHVRHLYPRSALFAAGWSLGANILVNYLGEQGADTPIEAAVSMCNPFDLTISNRQINEGFNKIYNWNLAGSLKRIFMKHQLVWRGHAGPAQPHRVPGVTTIREFDEAITVHSFDWDDVDQYYAGSSSAKRIPDVAVPLLCIQALDDPIAPAEAIPCDAIAANPNCLLAVTPCGGHLGWAAGPGAPFGEPWTDAAVFEWLSSVHVELAKRNAAGANGNGGGSNSVAVAAASAAGSAAAAAASPQRVAVSAAAGGASPAGSGGGSTASSGGGSVARAAGNGPLWSPRGARPPSRSSSSVAVEAGSGGGAAEAAGKGAPSARQRRRQQGRPGQLELADVEPALAMEQMWWGAQVSPRQQQQQKAGKRPASQPHPQQRQQEQRRRQQPAAISADASPSSGAGGRPSASGGSEQQAPQPQSPLVEQPLLVQPQSATPSSSSNSSSSRGGAQPSPLTLVASEDWGVPAEQPAEGPGGADQQEAAAAAQIVASLRWAF